jgi:hypothetical protein
MLTDRTYGMTKNQVLVAAKREILTNGWAQFGGSMEAQYVPGEPVCINLAIFRSAQSKEDYETRMKASDLVGEILGFECGAEDVPLWNDEPGRTLEEVIDVLDKAILRTAPKPREEKAQEIEMVTA